MKSVFSLIVSVFFASFAYADWGVLLDQDLMTDENQASMTVSDERATIGSWSLQYICNRESEAFGVNTGEVMRADQEYPIDQINMTYRIDGGNPRLFQLILGGDYSNLAYVNTTLDDQVRGVVRTEVILREFMDAKESIVVQLNGAARKFAVSETKSKFNDARAHCGLDPFSFE